MARNRFPYLTRFLKAEQETQDSPQEVSSVLSGGLANVSEINKKVFHTNKDEKSILQPGMYTNRGDKTDKTLDAQLKQLSDYPGCASCGCVVSVDGLCWGCHKSEINRRYPHLKPLAQFQQTVFNSASFYTGKVHWQDLANEYQEEETASMGFILEPQTFFSKISQKRLSG